MRGAPLFDLNSACAHVGEFCKIRFGEAVAAEQSLAGYNGPSRHHIMHKI